MWGRVSSLPPAPPETQWKLLREDSGAGRWKAPREPGLPVWPFFLQEINFEIEPQYFSGLLLHSSRALTHTESPKSALPVIVVDLRCVTLADGP